MKIAIDVSPLKKGHFLQHRVRGTGIYIENLISSLKKYYREHEYVFFTQGDNIPKDVDLVHYPYFEPFFITMPFFKRHKTVITVHDLTPLVFPQHFSAGIRGKIKWEIQKTLLKKVDAIIADSMCSKRDIVKHIGISEKKIHVVYLAASEEFKKVENTSILGSIRKKYNLPDKFALYVGDVTWNKNLPRLLEVVTKIGVPLVMVGKALINKNFDRKNSWNQDLVKVQKLANDNKRIIRLGFVPTEDLVGIYSLATVFVMPSLYEGFGLPILEAMNCSCLVITSNKGSLKEVAGEGAYYIDPKNIESIAKGLIAVFSNKKLRADLIEKGTQQAKKFSWQKTALETITVYEKVFQR